MSPKNENRSSCEFQPRTTASVQGSTAYPLKFAAAGSGIETKCEDKARGPKRAGNDVCGEYAELLDSNTLDMKGAQIIRDISGILGTQ